MRFVMRSALAGLQIRYRGNVESCLQISSRVETTYGTNVLFPLVYRLLRNASFGLEQHVFEAVILRHPEVFSDEAIRISKLRLKEWTPDDG